MSTETKERLLNAAERLFAEKGIQATSLREITAEAGANLAAVNYHFGSKEALIRSVLDRRLQPLNGERLRQLEEAEAAAGEAGPEIDAILTALVGPAFRLGDDDQHDFAALISRLHFETDENITELLVESFGEVQRRFFDALQRALPELSPRQLFFRLHFAIGAMAMLVVNQHVLIRASRGLITEIDTDNAIRRLVNFLSHGFRAPRDPAELEPLTESATDEIPPLWANGSDTSGDRESRPSEGAIAARDNGPGTGGQRR